MLAATLYHTSDTISNWAVCRDVVVRGDELRKHRSGQNGESVGICAYFGIYRLDTTRFNRNYDLIVTQIWLWLVLQHMYSVHTKVSKIQHCKLNIIQYLLFLSTARCISVLECCKQRGSERSGL